jgi:D-amino peptidase
MKVYLSVDMEGISGVVHGEELTAGSASWQAARQWMTDDVLAAIEGATAAGATEFLVVDGHAGMRNLLFDQLPASAVAHRGPAAGRTMCQVEGLDDSFDCMLLVGYHSMAGSDGLLSHTWHGGVVGQMRLDGVPIGETAINSSVAAHHGVPVVLATGDQYLAAEAERFVPGITTVTVKETTGRQNARCLPLPTTRPMIRDAAERAVASAGTSALALRTATGPVVVEIDTLSHRQADRIERFVDVERADIRTVRITADDVPSAFATAWLAVEVADFEAGDWNR